MELRIPLKLSQAVCFLAGFVLASVLSHTAAASADQKPTIPTDEKERARLMYSYVHDIWVQSFSQMKPKDMVKHLILDYNLYYPDGSLYKPN